MRPANSSSIPPQTRTSGIRNPESPVSQDIAQAKENLETAKRNLKAGQKELRTAENQRHAYLQNPPSAIHPVHLEDLNGEVFRKADSLHLLENRHRVAEIKLQALQAAPGTSGSQAVPETSGAIIPINLKRNPHPPAVSGTGRIAPDFFVPNHTPFDTHRGPTGRDLEKIKANVSRHQGEVASSQRQLEQAFGSFTASLVHHAERSLEEAQKNLEIARSKASAAKMEMHEAVEERKAFLTLTPDFFHEMQLEFQNISVQSKTDMFEKLERRMGSEQAHLETRESELRKARALHENRIPADVSGLSADVMAAKSKLETARRDLRASQYQERNFHEANDKYFGKP